MNYIEPDEIKWRKRVDEIDDLLEHNPNNRDDLTEEKLSLEKKLGARDEYDRNENNNMSSPDDTISNGRRPDSHPLKKLRDRITGDKKPEQPEQSDEQPPPHDHEQHQSRPEPDPEQQENAEGDTTNTSGIRTIPVVEVNVQAGPHASPQSQPSTNQQQPQQMRSLGRQSYQRAYMNTPDIWQYPSSRHDTDQVGLVQQSYKSYFGLP